MQVFASGLDFTRSAACPRLMLDDCHLWAAYLQRRRRQRLRGLGCKLLHPGPISRAVNRAPTPSSAASPAGWTASTPRPCASRRGAAAGRQRLRRVVCECGLMGKLLGSVLGSSWGSRGELQRPDICPWTYVYVSKKLVPTGRGAEPFPPIRPLSSPRPPAKTGSRVGRPPAKTGSHQEPPRSPRELPRNPRSHHLSSPPLPPSPPPPIYSGPFP